MRSLLLTIGLCAFAGAIEASNEAGATWWSLSPLRATQAMNAASDAHPIDGFLNTELEARGLSPNPEAEARALIRRLSYDLTGLPPSFEQAGAFAEEYAQDGERAYRRWVDRWLNDPAYGEKQARHWLDTVRYAESHGYDKDKPRPNAWPYRDYVIRSFNEEKPYARFVKEQIAGDALYPGTEDGIVGLGFLAAGPWDFIGHFEVGEGKRDGRIAKHNDRDDMVAATMNTFMSLTAQCAQCHDHKADPVSMEDYYSLQSVFAALDRAPRPYAVDPEVNHRRETLLGQIASVEAERAAFQDAAQSQVADSFDAIANELQRLSEDGALQVTKDPTFGYHSAIAADPSETKWVALSFPSPIDVATIRLRPTHDDYAGIGPGFGFPEALTVDIRPATGADWVTVFEGAHPASVTLQPLEIHLAKPTDCQSIRVTAQRLAPRRDDFIFALAELEVLDTQGDNRAPETSIDSLDSIEAPPRWMRANLINGRFPSPENPMALGRVAQLRQERDRLLDSVHNASYREGLQGFDGRLETLNAELATLPTPPMVYAVATDFPAFGSVHPTGGVPRPVRLLRRGDVDRPGELMAPGAPNLWEDALIPFRLPTPDNEQQRRAALAAYVTDPANPLTWRSIVNRVWTWTMGQGLVPSLNDFGPMGERPSHPELLDWLALWFRDESGGSIKALQRLIVTSAAYRRASYDQPEARAIDGDNRTYWRGSRRRLSAEELRDSLLLYADELDRTMGGPSFQDFVIEKPEHSPHYEYHLSDPADPQIHRRTIYRMIPRSQTQPFLTLWDCADPSQTTPQRTETTTALQALTLKHNALVVHLSKQAAQRWRGHRDPIQALYRTIFLRDPSPEESRLVMDYQQTHGLANTVRWIWNLNETLYLD